ncbi:MAG: NfeD family protein [Pyrinomonadaceae bacterium]|jgi:membrane protein implicated in regulation of membrane protease activity
MSEYAWILWAVLGLILIVAEILTPGFVLLWFGVGAMAAALASLAGFGYPLQFLIFFIVSVALTAASRTIFVNYFVRQQDEGGELKTGVDALPGKVGTVVISSRGTLQEGAVKVFGSTWTAFPAEGESPLEAGDRVVVERVEGASIYVRRALAEPGWRTTLPESQEARDRENI